MTIPLIRSEFSELIIIGIIIYFLYSLFQITIAETRVGNIIVGVFWVAVGILIIYLIVMGSSTPMTREDEEWFNYIESIAR